MGRTLPGGYTVLELVGVGGMGRVYRAEQQALGRTVAVKIIHSHLLSDESASARFITEARAASQLNHPNSVGVIDFGHTDDGLLYLVMEFLRGRDLARVVNESGLLPLKRLIDVVRQVLAALGEAHDLGIVHRDLKPENIILEPKRGGGDFVKVVDFGLAKVRAERSVTKPGIVCGTPDYMAPEQGRGDPIDGRSDLYAVGVILFLMLTGKLPFEGDSPTQVVLLHLTMPPPDPRQVAPHRSIPDKLASVCLKALSKDPDQRFFNADDFSGSLLESLSEFEISTSGEVVICPACGAPNMARQKFCGECGGRMPSRSDPTIKRARLDLIPELRRPSRTTTTLEMGLPLKNRTNDLAWLGEQLGLVRGSLVGARIVGEEGVGKSRLLREFVATIRKGNDRVVFCGPDPWWADVGYWSLRQVICGLTQLPPDGGQTKAWTGASAEARRGLAEVFGQTSGEQALSPESRRYLAAEALRWGLVRAGQLAEGGRVVVLLDDLHRMDGASRNAFADTLGEAPLAPALLVATHPPGVDAGWGAHAAARVLLGLPASSVAELFDGTSLVPPPLPDAETRGVLPLFAEHLLRFARDGGGVPPSKLTDLLALRIEHISPDARRLLQIIALLGEQTSHADATAMCDGSLNLAATLDALASAGLVSVSDGFLRVSHPLLREVVLAMIPVAVRRELYVAALRLAKERGWPLEVQALHATFAQDSFQALLLLEQSAALAASRADASSASLSLRRGLDVARREIFRGELDDPTRAVVIFSIKLGELLLNQGNLTDADGVLREALDLANPSSIERVMVLRALVQVARGRLRDQEATELLRKAIEICLYLGDHEMLRSLQEMRQASR